LSMKRRFKVFEPSPDVANNRIRYPEVFALKILF
jgi:hypothetical protein